MEAAIGDRVRVRMRQVAPHVTQAAMAEEIGVAPDAFSRSLNGKRSFTAVELVKLADRLETSAHWLITGEHDPFATRIVGRHAFDRDTGAYILDRDEEAQSGLDAIALAYLQVTDDGASHQKRNGSPSFQSAAMVRSLLVKDAGDDFVRRLADNVERVLGVDVVRIPNLSGDFALYVAGNPVIVINETGNWFRENFGIMHELGHILNGDLSESGIDVCAEPQNESRANRFAAETLMPAETIRSFRWVDATLSDVAELVWSLGVSTDALSARLRALGITVRDDTGEWLSWKTQTLLRRAKVPASGDDITVRMTQAATRRFPAWLIEAHRAAIQSGRLRPDTLAWMLGVDVDSVATELSPPMVEPDIDWLARELGLLD